MPQLRFLEVDEIERLLKVPNLRSDTGLRNRCILQMMWETGIRVGEAISIRPRDIVLNTKKLTVTRGKGCKTRVVYWRTEELTLLLERWKKRRPKSDFLFSTVRSKTGKGEKIEPRSFRAQFNRYVELAGLPDWTTSHCLRHSFSTHFLAEPGPQHNIRTLQIILGHSNLSVTERYLHISDKDVALAMRGY